MSRKVLGGSGSGVDVLLTGADGFIGRQLTQRFEAMDLSVIGTDIRGEGNGCVRMDITSTSQVRSVIRTVRPKRVVHLAAIVDDRGAPDLFLTVNVGGTQNVLEAAMDVALERFVHVSSIVALGFDPGRDADERSPLVTDTGSPYFDTKARSELIVRRVGTEKGVPTVIIRPGDVYGPGSEPWVLRPITLMRKRLPVLVDGGRGLIAHCWIDNLVDALVLATTEPKAEGHTFQIHDGSDGTTYRQYFRLLARAAQVPQPRLSLPHRPALMLGRAFDRIAKHTSFVPPFSEAAVRFISRRATYCMRSSRDILGFKPVVDLPEGMERLASALR